MTDEQDRQDQVAEYEAELSPQQEDSDTYREVMENAPDWYWNPGLVVE